MELDLDSTFEQAKRWIRWIDDSKESSIKAIESTPIWGKWFFGVSGGTELENELEIIPQFLAIRRLTSQRNLSAVYSSSRTIESSTLLAGYWIDKVDHELILNFDDDPKRAMQLGYYASLALSLARNQIIFCPVFSDRSLDAVSSAHPQSIRFWATNDLEKQWRTRKKEGETLNLAAQIERLFWALLEIHRVGRNLRTQVATKLYWSWPQTNNPRIALMTIWGGLDALFGKNEQQAKKNIARRISEFLPMVLEGDVSNLYKVRCDAIHGRHCSDEHLFAAVGDSAELLRTALVKIGETKNQPLADEQR